MKKFWFALAATAVITVGCNSEEIPTNEDTTDLQIVEVEITTDEKLNPNEPVLLEALVTQGDEFVNDADNVTFEVWESGLREHGEMVDGVFTQDGKYSVEYTFDHDGVYFVFAHTNARGLHIMPKKQLTVGNPDLSKVLEDNSSDSMDHMKDGQGMDDEESTDSGHDEHDDSHE